MTSKGRSVLFRMGLCGLILAAAGCAGGPAPPEVAEVSGVLTYKGVPVRDAFVKFMKEGSPIVAGGFTDDMGRFKLTSQAEGDGAAVGANKVTISVAARYKPSEDYEGLKAELNKVQDPIERRQKLSELNSRAKADRVKKPKEAPRSSIPAKYSDLEKTPLTFTVEAGKKNTFDIDIQD